MVSKNNLQERIRKVETKKERHSIRKFSVGAASVLIGFAFLGMNNQTVKADDIASEEVTVQNTDTENKISIQSEDLPNTRARKVDKEKKKDTINSANNEANKELQDAIQQATQGGVTVKPSNKKPINVSTSANLDEKIAELKKLNNAEINKVLKALEEHKTKMEKYKNDLAAFEQAKAEYIETLKKLGLWTEGGEHVDPSTLSQLLILGKEEATVTAESLVGDKVVKGDKKVLQLDNFWEVKESIKGDFLKVTYTDLKNSTYAGKAISKIVITFSDFDISKNSYQGNSIPGIYFNNNPIDGFFYRKCDGVTMNMEMFDANGQLIVLGDNTAYLTIGSLNNGTSSYKEYIEKAELLGGGKGIVLPESSVGVHKGPNGDILYADKDNDLFHKNPTAAQIEAAKKIWGEDVVKYLNWDDDKDRSREIFGSGLFQVSGNSIKIRFSNELGSAWVTYSTTIPKLTFNAVKPEMPTTEIEVDQYILKLNSNVYIHYHDVTDEALKGTTEFKPEHGTELKDKLHSHTDREVGSIYNTELWDWTEAGYVLAADHGEEVKSGTVTEDDQHHHIYLKKIVSNELPEQPSQPEWQPTDPQPTQPSQPEEDVIPKPEIPSDPIEDDVVDDVEDDIIEDTVDDVKDESVKPKAPDTEKSEKVEEVVAEALPQTGETKKSNVGVIGLALAGVASLIGLAGSKKRKKK